MLWDNNGIVCYMVNGWNMCVYMYKSGIVDSGAQHSCVWVLCTHGLYYLTHVLYVCMDNASNTCIVSMYGYVQITLFSCIHTPPH